MIEYEPLPADILQTYSQDSVRLRAEFVLLNPHVAPDDLLTLNQVAKALAVSDGSVLRWSQWWRGFPEPVVVCKKHAGQRNYVTLYHKPDFVEFFQAIINAVEKVYGERDGVQYVRSK